jgi:hypothetical protein
MDSWYLAAQLRHLLLAEQSAKMPDEYEQCRAISPGFAQRMPLAGQVSDLQPRNVIGNTVLDHVLLTS